MKNQKKTIDRRLVLLAGCLINFCLSGSSGLSVIFTPLIHVTGWSLSSVSLSLTLYNTMVCIMGIIVGTFSQKVKSRTIIYTGATLLSVGWFITGFSKNVLALQLLFSLIAGSGSGFLYNYSVTTTLKWFPEKKGVISGFNLGCAALGSMFSAPVITAVTSVWGPFAAYKVIGCIYALALLSVGWMMQTPPPAFLERAATGDRAQPDAQAGGSEHTRSQMLKTPDFYILYAIFVCACTSYLMILHSAATIGQIQAGMSSGMATLSVTLLALSNFTGRLFFGSLSDRLGYYKALLPAVCITLLSMLLMSVTRAAIPFMALMCLIGACGGACMALFPPIVSMRFGVRHSSQNYPLMFSAYSVASLIGPQLAARYEASGNYGPAFVGAAVISSVAIALLLIVLKKNASGRQAT